MSRRVRNSEFQRQRSPRVAIFPRKGTDATHLEIDAVIESQHTRRVILRAAGNIGADTTT